MHTLPISNWSLSEVSPDSKEAVCGSALSKRTDSPERTDCPGLVHEYLLANDLIDEPLEGLNCFESDWVAERTWRFVSDFFATEEVISAERADLVLEAIDGKARIFLNGECIGEHRSAFYPFQAQVGDRLRPGVNRIEVIISTGVEDFSAAEAIAPDGVSFATEESLGFRPDRGDLRRIFLRKPAFTFGWDWCPRVTSLGIPGAVYLRLGAQARLERILACTRSASEEKACVDVSVEIQGLHYYSSECVLLDCEIQRADGTVVAGARRKILVRSGLNVHEFRFSLDHPQLWWPRGHGGQPLYRLTATISTLDHELLDERTESFGIRTIRLNDCDRFTFEVNGKLIFCQGANWVPPDVIYTRPSDADYVRLIELAAQGNMNMLRVWGGGNYEREIFYSTCDRLGLLVWQDFMFACSPYPDHLEWFRQEVENEAEYQVRRLACHPCLALWCGSNENTWAFQEWWKDQTQRGARIYNEILPKAVYLHSAQTPYWTGSPYGGKTPNQTRVGNNHFWKDVGGYLAARLEDRLDLGGHDRYESFFISEYGFHGPCSLQTTRQYLGAAGVDRTSQNWLHHTNTRRYEETLHGAIKHLYGHDAADLPLEDYLYFGGLWQGLAASYAFDAARLRPSCSGSLLWMFNESWGEAGWGLVDYYQRKKIAWYCVRRALAAQRLILRKTDRELMVHAFSEQASEQVIDFVIGYSLLDGREIILDQAACALRQPRTEISRVPIPADIEPGGLFFARCDSDCMIEPGVLWPGDLRSLAIPEGEPSIIILEERPARLDLLVSSPTYLHGVYFESETTLGSSDNYFDVMPGETRQVSLSCPPGERSHIHIGWMHGECRREKTALRNLLSSRSRLQPSIAS